MHLNSVTLVGTVASGVRRAGSPGGPSAATFRMVCQARGATTATEQLGRPPTFVTVLCRGRLAGNVLQALAHGDPVVVTGLLRVEQRFHEGRRITRVKVDAVAVGLDLARSSPIRRVNVPRAG